ncbi:hypothetical protein EDD37DRAFT_463504 [Exophiala viscosa]|uniref:uncharacterized protein n=1 Tax=Exophiala viscosa TaxID=2486360 RepID=UPI0021A0B8AC|nr:hypothetical protein EDD37DRAFT_463504 [Exophiala viscosa]
MGMPREIRDTIYKLLLVKEDSILVQFDRSHGYIRRNHETGHEDSDYSIVDFTAMTVGPKHITSILRANKQFMEEGTDILYGENLFESYHIRAFDDVFVKNSEYGIGRKNAAKIKSARFGVPQNIIVYDLGHDDILDFLCKVLKNLQHLTLTTRWISEKPTSRDDGEWVKLDQGPNIRALLTAAARVTKFHPGLRKAIWRQWSGGYFSKGWRYDDYSESQVDELVGAFFVDLVVEGLAPVLKGSTTKKDPYGEDFQSRDMVLNSQLVRSIARYDKEGWRDLQRFGLRNDVKTSEVDPSRVESWLGPKQHNLLAEVDPESAAAEERYLAYMQFRAY